MKRFQWFALIILCVLGTTDVYSETAKLKVGLVLDKGGRDDKSFNAAAFKGATEAQQKLGIELKVVESSDDAALEPALQTFAQQGYPLVIGIGFILRTPIERVAKRFPKTHFLLVDADAKLPNVRSVLFKEHEGSFLVGAIAALTSKSNTVGFVGGMAIPLIRRFEVGYRAGVKHVAPKTQVLVNYVGESSEAWRNPMKGKELALKQYNQNADVIFAAAGASALGVFDAAEQLKKYIIGCDSNQNSLKPGRVLTSMLKRVDIAVYKSIELESQGKFVGGFEALGLKEGGVDYAVDEYNKALIPPAVKKQVEALRADILKGKIVVPDFYVTKSLDIARQ